MRRWMVTFLVLLVTTLALAACGSGEPSDADIAPQAQKTENEDQFAPPPIEVPADCPKPSTELELKAVAASWADEKGKSVPLMQRCLSVPAGEDFTLSLSTDNTQSEFAQKHNVAIYLDGITALEPHFQGEHIRVGKSITYEIGALESGNYLFRCDLHVQNMKGVLVVE